MARMPYLLNAQKRTARITIMTQHAVRTELERMATAERRPLSSYCEAILVKNINKNKPLPKNDA